MVDFSFFLFLEMEMEKEITIPDKGFFSVDKKEMNVFVFNNFLFIFGSN